ncbi:MAG TPA: hypothetical protein VFQ54_04885, partial [Thermomicrobiales bacterium]|nr:hypothetical protein [Thermomicrobiales bacterium]
MVQRSSATRTSGALPRSIGLGGVQGWLDGLGSSLRRKSPPGMRPSGGDPGPKADLRSRLIVALPRLGIALT